MQSRYAIGEPPSLPPVLLHRFGNSLRVNNRRNQALNDVRTESRNGLLWALKAEPFNGKVPVGVSFFDIQRPYLQHQHSHYHNAGHGQCYTTKPSGCLPAGVAILQDTLLRFPFIRENGQVLVQGRHFSLYPTEDMLLSEFAQKVMQTRHVICDLKAEAEPLGLPDPTWPSDARMCNVVVALTILSERHKEPNTALLAWAYALHIGYIDMAYAELLEDPGVLPSLTAFAIEQRPLPETAHEVDMCDDIKTDLGRLLDYMPTLFADEVEEGLP
ncbi:hypothetical protein WJX79_004718 [Trebouxia sp. C0005]